MTVEGFLQCKVYGGIGPFANQAEYFVPGDKNAG